MAVDVVVVVPWALAVLLAVALAAAHLHSPLAVAGKSIIIFAHIEQVLTSFTATVEATVVAVAGATLPTDELAFLLIAATTGRSS